MLSALRVVACMLLFHRSRKFLLRPRGVFAQKPWNESVEGSHKIGELIGLSFQGDHGNISHIY